MKTASFVFLAILLGFGAMYGYFTLTQTQQQKTQTTNKTTESKFSLAEAPSDTMDGKIISLSGETKWESRSATEPAILKQPVVLKQGEEVITGPSGSMAVQFPKGTNINISANSDVSFIQTFPQSMVIAQKSGYVTYLKSETSPLFIRSNSLLLELQKGSITVSMTDNFTTVTVLSGSITAAYNNIDTKSIVSSVTAGERFIYDNITKDGTIE